MDSSIKDEKKMIRYTYLFIVVCFFNLFLIKQPFEKGALIMGAIVIALIAYTHFVVRRFFPDGDKYILIISCVLSSIGIVMLHRLNPSVAIKQVIWFIVGITAFILVVVLVPNLSRFKKYRRIYLGLTVGFMAMATFIGTRKYGSQNWVMVGSFGFQPSEFGKIFLVAYLASSLEKYKNFKNLIEPAFVVTVSLGFMVLQKDLGSVLIFFGISITMLYIATSKLKYIVTCLGMSVFGAMISYKLFSHVRLRIMIWKNPWLYANNESFQVVQSMYSIASGGLFGTGLKLGHPEFVPVNQSDFIFSAICEEFGLLMGLAIMILFFLLFYRCMRAALHAKSNFSKLLAVGYSAMIASQVLVIVGGVINAIPLTGITLPLVSYGGSSIIITFFSLGILQKISEGDR